MKKNKKKIYDHDFQKMVNLIKFDQNIISGLKKISRKIKSIIIFSVSTLILFPIVIAISLEFDYLFVNYIPFKIGLIILALIILSLIIFIILFSIDIFKIKKKKIYPYLLRLDWTYFYNTALEIFFKKQDWKITDFEYNTAFFKNKNSKSIHLSNRMHVEYKEAKLIFNIIAKIERKSYFYFFLTFSEERKTHIHEKIRANRKDFDFSTSILLKKNKNFSNSDFETESVAFNKIFEIETQDQILAAKWFTPKVIDKYSTYKVSNEFQGVELKNKSITSYVYREINKEEKYYELGLFKIYSNLDKFKQEIIYKIKEDLNLFYKNLAIIDPLL